ncbi:hypothetical protein NPIL_83421 [Nephila pilipes]|uniref:Uncharacterized protein n=1 Tax=Nephila pilipes TaxID=299642 RepID=A0A8X6TFF1_NEPPI|nr:hypothetical protein NPIL_83421 [Nephila pilipes]
MCPRCTQVYLEGYYGDHCMQQRQCKNENYICNSISGCICKCGYGGDNSEIRLMGQSVKKMDDDNSSTSAGVVGGVTLAIVLLIALILVTLYYRRHLKRLKDELAYETYAADPNPSPDRRHFDNLVYAYKGVPPPSTSLNDTGTKDIYNDLGMKSNLNKAKLGDEDSETYACTEQKNQIGTRD